jgi:hypothetical protein
MTTTEPTHPCVRCGRPIALDLGMCEECNPLGLRQPSASQVHGIAVVGIVAFVIFLAVLAHGALGGVGPFHGLIRDVAATDGGLAVTLLVGNDGTKSGATTCRVVEASRPVGGPGEVVQTPLVPAGSDRLFTLTVTKLGTVPVDLAVDCQSP